MRKTVKLMMLASLAFGGGAVLADTVDERLDSYRAQGAGPFDAARGESMWNGNYIHARADKPRNCASCHTDNLKLEGQHARTGKEIAPMAPSVNAKRLTETREIEKWFGRNCKWTMGRECTAQEKGDFLSYIRLQ